MSPGSISQVAMDELLADLSATARVLDLGAGPGSFTYASTAAKVVAVDVAFPEGSQPSWGRVIASSEQLPFKDSSLEAVVCNNALEHFEKLPESLGEIGRIIKKKGALWVAVPDGSLLDDRLYRFLFEGGGHVNRFSLRSLIESVEFASGLRAKSYQKLHSGFVYLNPPDPLKLPHYPGRALFLGRIPPPLLKLLLRWFNYLIRLLARLLRLNLAQYGWGVVFTKKARPGLPSRVAELESVASPFNVCFSCGAGSLPSAITPSLRRFLLWRFYRCPKCGEKNVFVKQPTSPASLLPQHPQIPGVEGETPAAFSGRSLEEVAKHIFGTDHPESVRGWVRFWEGTSQRAAATLETYRKILPLDFEDKRVLDIGCGTGGLGELIDGQCRLYVGGDYHHHILQFARLESGRQFVQCNGIHLPFADHSFDYVFAGDVIEHLIGGRPWQVQFLRELRRVATPLGMIFLSTPNRWYPYEGHTGLYLPQYLPSPLSDRYIRRFNPGFLKEHGSFAEIRLLGPTALKDCLRKSGLRFLHQLPCTLDRSDFRRHFRGRGLLAYLGLGWSLHAEFWGVLVRKEKRERLRLKLTQHWGYENAQPSETKLRDFTSVIDFEQGLYNQQLGTGWYWHQRDARGYRWTKKEVTCFLETSCPSPYVRVHGFSPQKNYLQTWVEGVLVGEHPIDAHSDFRLEFLIPFPETDSQIISVTLRCSHTFRPESEGDERELGVMIFSVGLFEHLE